MQHRIFITGYYGFGNTGDEAILVAMIAHLRAICPNLDIVVTSADPAQTRMAHNVDAILWSDALAMLDAVSSADLILVGGGGIFHDYWGFNPNAVLTDNHWGISFYTSPAIMAALFHKPLMLYGVGIGPLLSEHGRRFTRVACDVAQLVTVRDAASEALLREIGVPPEKVRLAADPVFAFPMPASEETDTPAKVVGVALRHWDIGVYPAFWENEAAIAFDAFLEEHPEYT
ncbi:MAG TPA: polysaccharide pyruvyl transferase family protein, partial [Chthoniobacterales bacterium]|nr:polysaccharide pyruvyl transferase family protein [Chthoniobacterales bacterium]